MVPVELARAIHAAAAEMAKQAPKAFRIEPRRRSRRGGATLRPGNETPLWNELRAQLRPHLLVYATLHNAIFALRAPCGGSSEQA